MMYKGDHIIVKGVYGSTRECTVIDSVIRQGVELIQDMSVEDIESLRTLFFLNFLGRKAKK